MLERRTRRAPVEPALKYPMPRALLIFVGLLRTMEVTFPALRYSLIHPNEHAFSFHAVIATLLKK